MKLPIRFTIFSTITAILINEATGLAIPDAIALPWAQANPQAFAAANAYADAYADAIAIAHPDPEGYALAASADDCATIACHASCGLLIMAGTGCSENTEDTYQGPYNTTCLCSAGSDFNKYYAPCMECGWTLWKYYGGYVSSALAACQTMSTEPTGTLRCSTTLTDSYTIETGIQGCSFLGNCPTTTSTTIGASSSDDILSSSSGYSSVGSLSSIPQSTALPSIKSSSSASTSKQSSLIEVPSSSSQSSSFTGTALLSSSYSVSSNPDLSATSSGSSSEFDTFSSVILSFSSSASSESVSVSPSSSISSDNFTSFISDHTSSISSISSSSAIPTVEPKLSGKFVKGKLEWTLDVPAALGPWNSFSLITSQNRTDSFNFDSLEVLVNNEQAPNFQSTIFDDSIKLSFTFDIGDEDTLLIKFGGEVVSGSTFTALASLNIITPEGKKFIKRAEKTWELSNTITADVYSTSSLFNSSTSLVSSGAASSSAVSSTIAPGSLASSTIVIGSDISTDVVNSPSTTIITDSSCFGDVCSETESTAQLSVVTTTINGEITSYTTYCPSTTVEHETTIVTVSSSSEFNFSEVASTTQVIAINSTIEGVDSTYTPFSQLTAETTTDAAIESTDPVTVISCQDDVCSFISTTTPKTTITSADGEYVESTSTTHHITDDISYTTQYITSTKNVSNSETEELVEVVTTKSKEATYTDTNIFTDSATYVDNFTSETSTNAVSTSSVPNISTFEGVGNLIAGSFIGIVFPFLFI